MSLFKCKMCGGSLEVAVGETIIECEYCGTQQTLPKTTDENIQALFNRANLLRQKNEFDKAESIYEKILEADDTEAEAYWGVILCKFGIEYVEDPKTYKRIPTCHRTSYDSIVADEYYKKALEYADITQRIIYETESKKIDTIQKGILAISAQEEPYDVFICYKETDENGRRTQDSVIANDIYYQLTQEGFKVFYAAITLEDKLGSAYEPIIFAALNSSKVMLSIGTKPEYFNAVWVKNEWSRFLKMMKNDRTKMLIPCYRGMDAYELPEEFAHLQAQDMGKIGFINDVVRGIKKVIVKDDPKVTVVKETVVSSSNSAVDPLLKRAFMFLEDEEWSSAKEYAEKVLDIDPENAKAYLVKFLAEYDLKNCSYIVDAFATPFFKDENAEFKKAMRFADDALHEKLNGYIKAINDRNEHERLAEIYKNAQDTMELDTYAGYLDAIELFESIKHFSDAEKFIEICNEKAEVCRKNEIYDDAIYELEKYTVASFSKAIKLFKSISGWKDADEQLAKCENELPKVKEEEEQERIRLEKEAEERRKLAQKAKKITTIIAISIGLIILISIIISIATSSAAMKEKYNNVISLKNSGNYADAYILCKEIISYKDCATIKSQLEADILEKADELYLDGEAGEASNLLKKCNMSNPGYAYVSSGDYKEAVNSGLRYIVIPNGVTTIPAKAFEDCYKLDCVKIPSTVTSIGEDAFSDCYNLKSVTIPKSVTNIGEYAFYNCSNLTSITIPNSVTSIGDGIFSNCSNLERVILSDNITSIGKDAFYQCQQLSSIKIPDSVTSIGSCAFYNCQNLSSVTIGNGVKSIDYNAFWQCSSLTSVNIPNGVTSIGGSAFSSCRKLTSITIPNSVISIGDRAFSQCSSLTNISIPNSVTSIGVSAFSRCSSLKNITIPDSVTSIGDYAFSECTELTSITIPDGVTSIGINTFSNCKNLTSAIIGKSVTSIGERAFEECEKLITITFGSSVTYIDDYAFWGSTNIATVYYYGTKSDWENISKSYFTFKDANIIYCS